MDRTRNGNGYAPDRITFGDIRSAFGERPAEWESIAIIRMDDVRLELWVHERGQSPEERPQVSKRELTTELFDALWS